MIYFKSVEDPNNPVEKILQLLPAQKNPATGAYYNVTEKISVADRVVLNTYPVGTFFGTETFRQVRNVWTASTLKVFVENNSNARGRNAVTDEEWAAFREYKTAVLDTDDDLESIAEAEEKKEKGRSFIEKLLEKFPCPTIKTHGFYIDNMDYAVIANNIVSGVNTCLKGPAGSGKTELLLMLCNMFNLPCRVYHMGAMQDPLAQLNGSHRIGPDGKSVFEYARFVDEIQQPGYILLDEITRAPKVAENILYPLLDGQRTLTVDGAGAHEQRIFKVHPDCHFLATANVGTEYTGTETQDKALRSRFHMIELDYMPTAEEINLLVHRKNVEEPEAKNIVFTADAIRKAARRGDLSTDVSIRETLRAAEMVAHGFDTQTAMTYCFLPCFEGDANDTESERYTVKMMFFNR